MSWFLFSALFRVVWGVSVMLSLWGIRGILKERLTEPFDVHFWLWWRTLLVSTGVLTGIAIGDVLHVIICKGRG